jgi:hypothetical protein
VARNRYQTPTGQVLTPAGRQVRLPGMRPQALALSPDGTLLATAGRNQTLVLMDPANGRIRQTIPLSVSTFKADNTTNTVTAQLSFTGLVLLRRAAALPRECRRECVGLPGGCQWVCGAASRGRASREAPNAAEIPTGWRCRRTGISRPRQPRQPAAGARRGRAPARSWETPVAPQDIVLVGEGLCQQPGGRRPGQISAPREDERVDPVRHIANEGSITVIDPPPGGEDGDSGGTSRVGAGRLLTAAMSLSPTAVATRCT